MNFHMLWTPQIARPWWPTHERFPETAGKRIWTDCCCCKQPAEQTDARIVAAYDPPIGGPGFYQEPPEPWEHGREWAEPYYPTGAYFESSIDVRCAEGFGCNANPRKKRGRALREVWRFGA